MRGGICQYIQGTNANRRTGTDRTDKAIRLELNLITGTRYLNTEGMEGFENTVGDYVAEMENHVVWEDTKL